MALLLEDEDTNVRLAVLSQFGSFIDVVGLTDEPSGDQIPLMQWIVRLSEDKNWRVRLTMLELFPKLATELGFSGFVGQFDYKARLASRPSRVYLGDSSRASASLTRRSSRPSPRGNLGEIHLGDSSRR